MPYKLKPDDVSTIDLLFPPAPLEGWLSREKADVVYALVREFKPKLVVEIGTFAGMSEFCIALALKANGSGIVIGIDPWCVSATLEGTNTDANEKWWSAVDWNRIIDCYYLKSREFGLLDYTSHLRKYDEEAVKIFCPESINLIHLDGNHSPEISCATVKRWWPMLASGCIIIADDVNWDSVKPSLELLRDLGATTIKMYETFGVFRKP
jgi:predicted O-methyltransferase YrrM